MLTAPGAGLKCPPVPGKGTAAAAAGECTEHGTGAMESSLLGLWLLSRG